MIALMAACAVTPRSAPLADGNPAIEHGAYNAGGSGTWDAAKLTGELGWKQLEPGLEFAEVDSTTATKGIFLLRIDPELFDFVLCSSREEDMPPKTLSDWGDQNDLVAAINASMYLPDGVTSTGFMKNGNYINNPRIANRFGAFFVSGPVDDSLPKTGIIERDNPSWRQLIDQYTLVVQNYRMTNSEGRILWARGGALYAISAVAQASDGKILFLHSREPVEAHSFVQTILSMPVGIKSMMYVEGGAQAGLLVRTPAMRKEISGRHAPSLLVTGNSAAVLPNVIGVRRKTPR